MPPEATPPVRVLVVDDEPLARRAIREVLEREPRFEVVGEAGDGIAAIEAIERLRPQLVFLDMQMPGCDGLEALAQVEADMRPAVVFATAYEHYAIQAFDLHAVDYLLKPFDDARLLAALDRALQRLGADDRRMQDLLDQATEERPSKRFVCKHAGRLRLVDANEVEWIEARGNYVHLHHPDGPFLVRRTLTSLAKTLPEPRFQRVHRSAIVALPEVCELDRRPGGDHELVLRSGARVPLGRSHRADFQQRWRQT
ncbi:MAG: LytR/AlgR family response regulator transcription factor [Planctomycetota bacterium]